MLVCPACRGENAEDGGTCTHCGRSLAPGPETFPPRRPEAIEEIELRPPSKRRTDWTGALMAAALVALVAFGLSRVGQEHYLVDGAAVSGSAPVGTGSAPGPGTAFRIATLRQQADQVAEAWAFHMALGNAEQLSPTVELARAATGCEVRPYEIAVSRGERAGARARARELTRTLRESYGADAVGSADYPVSPTRVPLMSDEGSPAVSIRALVFLYECSSESAE